MRGFLLLFLLLPLFAIGQLSPSNGGRIGNNSTAFGVNISQGATVFDIGATKGYFCITASPTTDNLTTGAAKFKQIALTADTGGNGKNAAYFWAVTQFNLKAPISSPTFTGTVNGITATMVGLSNVVNYLQVKIADSNKTAAGNYVTRKRLDSIAALKAPIASPTFTTPTLGAALGTSIQTPTIPASNNTATGVIETDTANVNMGLGDVVFIGGTNTDRMVLCKADAIANCPYAFAICTATVTAGNVGTYLTHGDLRNDSWTWTKGGQIYVSTTGTTGNTLTQTAPSGANNVILCVGVAKTAKVIKFQPNYIPIEHN